MTSDNWNLCRAPLFGIVENNPVSIDPLAVGTTHLEAQTLFSADSENLRLEGDVRITSEQQTIIADSIDYNKSSQIVSANGNVVVLDANSRFRSPSVRIDKRNDRASFEETRFEILESHASGEAQQIEQLDQYRSRFLDLTYTTCDPGNRVWHLKAAELEIDDESGRGSATNTTIYFQEIPFLYLPWFQFPIDDRRLSGILTPTFGNSEDRGTTIEVPVYWNMAPNYDMTITPDWYSKRGLQLNTENRYLFGSHRGQIDLSYLDDDLTGESRWFQQWRHNTTFAYDIKGRMILAEVSDGDLFDDFGNVAPEYNDILHLAREVSFSRSGEFWQTDLLWQNYQTLNQDSSIGGRPYNRLPRIAMSGSASPAEDTRAPIALEWVNFDREDSVTGQRADVKTAVNWRSSNSWYFFNPGLQVRFTDYQLEDNTGPDSINRTVPTLSIDTGLIFERPAGSDGQWLQTLEPRLYFLKTPFEDQDDIPDFDTANNSKTYSNLFKNNRFTGADRVGDAEQVTFGLTSRLLANDSGRQLARARIGRVFYFEDRRVSLNGSTDDATRSDVISELVVSPSNNVKLSARLVYDEDQHDVNDRDLAAQYTRDGAVANLGYYFEEDKLEQALISLVYPLDERWSIAAKYHRSLLFERPVENLLGLSYESCCWGLKMLAGRTAERADQFEETDDSIYFEFTFKGLSSTGQQVDSQLEEAILGYRPGF